LVWKVDGKEHFHERPVSTQQTGFSFVAQMRGWLPAPIGGVLWFGVDDTFSTVYFPAYAGITRAPHSYARGTGSFHEVTWESAFWVFNQVSNFAYLRYRDMIKDVQVVQRELEGRFLAELPDIDAAAVALYRRSPRLAREYLTAYSAEAGDEVVDRWRTLSKSLLYKYLDGMVKDESGKVTEAGYPESWYRTVARATGPRLEMKQLAAEVERAKAAAANEKTRPLVEAIMIVLRARGIAIDSSLRDELGKAGDAELEKWLVRAATADSAKDLRN
jgi:hypothetical protein